MADTQTPEFGSLREKIAWEKTQRLARYAHFERVHERAHVAGVAAAEDMVPTPMHVVERANPFDDSSPVVKAYAPVEGGVCGFAWVTVRPGNSSFAIWASKNKGWSKSYPSGMKLWVSIFGQSMERKEAYARAFASVLRDELEINAYAGSRMD